MSDVRDKCGAQRRYELKATSAVATLRTIKAGTPAKDAIRASSGRTPAAEHPWMPIVLIGEMIVERRRCADTHCVFGLCHRRSRRASEADGTHGAWKD